MFVRTYARRAARCGGGGGRSASDPVLLDSLDSDGDSDSAGGDLLELPAFAQDGSYHSRPAPFSSQDSSSPWSIDPFDLPDDPPPLPPSLLFASSRGEHDSLELDDPGAGRGRGYRDPAAGVTTSTLMEAQEFGEMMEHVDEVNFALDGLRPWQPERVRRASLLSLLSSCGTAQQRRLLRVRGMARRIIDAILDLNLDDSPSTVAAAALFYVLASDVQDDHLLDSPSCIGFLLKLLNPKCSVTTGNNLTTLGSKILGKRKPHVVGSTSKGLDSTAKAIISKVAEILVSCKEIKPCTENDEGTGRPELNSRWIALLTMEKACLSTVSFEDTSDMVKMPGGEFKENLRELGGLDAIFDVLASCHSTLEAWHCSSSFPDLKGESVLQSMLLLLKCLKIMENATFLSKDNQTHLLGMKQKSNSGGLQLSFVGVIISAIEFFSDFSLHQTSSSSSNKGKVISEGQSFQVKPKLKDDNDEPSSSHYSGCSGVDRESEVKVIRICHKRQKSSYSLSEVSLSGSEKPSDFPASVSCDAIKRSIRDKCANGVSLKTKFDAIGSRMNSHKISNKWVSIKTNGATTNSDNMSKRPSLLKDVKDNSEMDMFDPFAFDEGDLKPSKWEMLAKKKEKTQSQGNVAKKEHVNARELPIFSMDDMLSQLTSEENQRNCTNSHISGVDEDSSLVEDCLLTSVKVLMNLTNDNPLGCQQIAACGGLHTMVSLIINHFPSFDCCFQMNSKMKGNKSTSEQHNDGNHRNNKHLNDHELDLLVALLGLLVNLVEKDSRNRFRLAEARVSTNRLGKSENMEAERDAIPLLCSIFLANQGNEAKEEKALDDEESLLQGAKEAEMMIIEAYAALLLGFLSIESSRVREAIASCLPKHNLQALVPVLERFVAFHLQLNMITPETHSAVVKVIESCKGP